MIHMNIRLPNERRQTTGIFTCVAGDLNSEVGEYRLETTPVGVRLGHLSLLLVSLL